MKEKLIELLSEAQFESTDAYVFHRVNRSQQLEMEADHLIANGVTIQKWIPVTERLPERDELVLGYDGEEVFPCYFVEGRGFCGCTHWMPLPEQPKDEQPQITERTMYAIAKIDEASHGEIDFDYGAEDDNG